MIGIAHLCLDVMSLPDERDDHYTITRNKVFSAYQIPFPVYEVYRFRNSVDRLQEAEED